MSFAYDIFKESDCEALPWEGGKTRRIAIEPRLAIAANRDFIWCFSNASIEKPTAFSNFTGYNRQIIPIAGDLTLRRGTGKTIDSGLILKRVYGFDGAEETQSIGIGETLNLIYRYGVEAHTELYNIAVNAKKTSVVRAADKFRFITFIYYVLKGSLSVVINDGVGFILSSKDTAVVKTINGTDATSVALSSSDGCEAARVKLFY